MEPIVLLTHEEICQLTGAKGRQAEETPKWTPRKAS